MLQDGLVALSLANLCLMGAWFPMLYDADLSYFNKVPVLRPALLALATNILGFALLAWLIMRALRRFESRALHLACHLIFLCMLLVPLDFCRRTVFHITDYQLLSFLNQPLVILGAVVVLASAGWKHRQVARLAAVATGILSPLALFTLARIALLCLGAQHLAQDTREPVLPPLDPVRESQPRVVWIIFDETDQRLAFEQRPAGHQLPEFDRLRGEALCATNAYPPGDSTLLSMPALISGRPVSAVSIKNASDLNLAQADGGDTALWSQLPSVFSSARQLRVNTALVGWAHPYARVLGRALNYCAWYPIPGFEPGRASTFGASLKRELGCLAGTIHLRQLYADVCRASLTESLALVTNSMYGLILLHLPPPHRPGIYRPEKDQYTIYGMPKVTGYFNNLMLADHFLGKLRQAMEKSGQWDKTWVIMSADHSWRESRLYDGRRDLRVPFLVKAPGQSKAITLSSQMNTLLTHDLILAILRGEIIDQQNAAVWLDTHLSAQPTVPDTKRLD